jgi:hypothetical protein
MEPENANDKQAKSATEPPDASAHTEVLKEIFERGGPDDVRAVAGGAENSKPPGDQTLEMPKLIREQIGFLQTNQQQVHENIKFADAKAGVVITADSALLASVYAVISSANLRPKSLAAFTSVGVCLLLISGAALGFLVVKPRGEKNRSRGFGVVDADRINQTEKNRQSQTTDDDTYFMSEIENISDRALIKEMHELIFDRSFINHRKYLWLRRSLKVSALGWAAAFLFAGWVTVFPLVFLSYVLRSGVAGAIPPASTASAATAASAGSFVATTSPFAASAVAGAETIVASKLFAESAAVAASAAMRAANDAESAARRAADSALAVSNALARIPDPQLSLHSGRQKHTKRSPLAGVGSSHD